MPCIEVSLPQVDRNTKSALAMRLTEAFSGATGHPTEILGVRFFEYEAGSAAVGGKLCGDSASDNGPYLHVLVYCPRLKRSTKVKLGAALTEAFAQASGRPGWVPVIHLCEHPYDNVVVGGKLLSETYEECARRKFYYELPAD